MKAPGLPRRAGVFLWRAFYRIKDLEEIADGREVEKLREWFAENPKVLIGFSGGVDSAFLLAAAKECGAEALPVFIKTPFQPDFELRDAEQLAASLGIKPEVLTADPLSDPEILANGPERCYYCKRMLFSMLRRLADERGAP